MRNLDFARAEHRALREQLLTEDPDLDERTLADTVEGLTNLHEILAAILRAALIDEALISGLRERMGEMQDRCDRLTERALKRRQLARHVMIDAEIKKIIAPDFTVSIRSGTPELTITDEAPIPAAYWEPREPRLNRQALLSDLKQGEAITGAALSNAEPVLSVRTK